MIKVPAHMAHSAHYDIEVTQYQLNMDGEEFDDCEQYSRNFTLFLTNFFIIYTIIDNCKININKTYSSGSHRHQQNITKKDLIDSGAAKLGSYFDCVDNQVKLFVLILKDQAPFCTLSHQG